MLQQEVSRQEESNETIKIFYTKKFDKATDKYAKSKIIGHRGYGTMEEQLQSRSQRWWIKVKLSNS